MKIITICKDCQGELEVLDSHVDTMGDLINEVSVCHACQIDCDECEDMALLKDRKMKLCQKGY